MLSIIDTISGEQYQQVIQFVCDKSDAVCLVFRSHGQKYRKTLKDQRQKLRPYRLSTRCNQAKKKNEFFSWPGTDTWDYDSVIHVDLYRLSKEVRQYIASVDNMFDWIYPDRPEDISFFKNGECWFMTTAHEKMCDFVDNEKETARFLDQLSIQYQVIDGEFTPFRESYSIKE